MSPDPQLNIVFCADRSVLPGLHVAALSLLERMSPAVAGTRFTIFSEALDEGDMAQLHQTLSVAGKSFTLELRRVEAALFADFPPLNGSWATYYRLLAPLVMPVERFLYVDADTLCDVDVSGLFALDMGGLPAGWVPEAPLTEAVDRQVAERLGNSPGEFYFNAGILLVNVPVWRQQQITEQALECLKTNPPAFWDQSALNLVLHRRALALETRFNCIANMRRNWPALCRPYGEVGRLLHFLDYPKPWDLLGECLHPQYRLWRSVLDRTGVKNFRSWQKTPARKFPQTLKAWSGYKKAFKDRLLLAGYSRGWLKRVKGVH